MEKQLPADTPLDIYIERNPDFSIIRKSEDDDYGHIVAWKYKTNIQMREVFLDEKGNDIMTDTINITTDQIKKLSKNFSSCKMAKSIHTIQQSRYSKLRTQLSTVKSLTGITAEKFDELLKKLDPVYNKHERDRLSYHKLHLRAEGGGRKPKLQLEDKLLIYFMFRHLNLTHCFLGQIFNFHNSNISRQIKTIEPALKNIHTFNYRSIRLGISLPNHKEIKGIFKDLDKECYSETLNSADA
ncbi:hypothetical protein BH10BAC5_BH10BAC5_17210 [soil metagenome]